MSKNKKQKQETVYMQIEKFANEEPLFLRVPNHFQTILDRLMQQDDTKDYRNSKIVLKIFCEEFAKLNTEERDKVKTLINCKIAPVDTVFDLITIMQQRDRYYILDGVDTNQKLGEFHIFAARNNAMDNWVAKEDYANSKLVGKKIRNLEKGEFFQNSYVGKYGCF